MPKPERYIIFTGNTGRKPDKISLSKEFFNGEDIDFEVRKRISDEQRSGGSNDYDEFI